MDGVLHLRAETGRAFRREPDLHALYCLNRDNRLCQPAVEPRIPRDVRPQSGRHAARDHFENAAHRVARAVGLVDDFFHAGFHIRVDAAEQNVVAAAERDQFVPGRSALEAHRAHRDDMAEHVDAEFRQQGFGDRADGHPRGGLAGAGAFQNVPRVVKIVLDGAGEVGMSGPRPGDRLTLVLAAVEVFHRQSLGPVLPVFVADEDGDGRADGAGVADSGDDFGAVGFDLHAPAAAVALLAPPELAVDGIERYGYACGKSGQRGHQAFAVGLAGGLKSQHSVRRFYRTRLKQKVGFVRKRWVMVKFLLWCVLLILCWPLALAALVLYPIVWLVLLPFRVVGIAVGGALELVWAIVTLPARLMRAIG